MKPTPEDAKPRRDGWHEHAATWQEVVVGTVIADPEGRRTKAWEVIEVAHGVQVEPCRTLWMRLKEVTSGELMSMPPRLKVNPVTILTRDPADTQAGEPTPPTDAEAVMALVEGLGARLLASRDERTGEITCPDYASGGTHEGVEFQDAEMEHLEFAHGIDISSLRAMTDINARHSLVWKMHKDAHDPKSPAFGAGGFPHRHVPEDLTIFTGMR